MTKNEITTTMEVLGKALREKKQKEEDFALQLQELNDTIEELKSRLRPVFLASKESAANEWLVVSYRKGAVRWDTAGLRKYAKDHPEIKVFQTTAEPTVAFSLPKEEEA